MRLRILILFLFISSLSFAQNIDGKWNGKLKFDTGELPLAMNIKSEEDGKIECDLDSPLQNAYGIESEILYYGDDSLSLVFPKIGAKYAGKVIATVIRGTFSQNGSTFSLDFMKDGLMKLRLQRPLPPFPYECSDVVFKSEDAELSGTLTVPLEQDCSTVLLLVGGSGLQDRDETVFGHKPFAVITDYLARNGVATLRYDDRGCGKSKGNVEGATMKDFANDAFAGLQYLKRLGSFEHIGILGHSEGASIAFMSASRGFADFVVSLAGIGVRGNEALAEQVNRVNFLSGVHSSVTPEQYLDMAIESKELWLIDFCNYDPSDDISKTNCPVMAVNGSKDCQVVSSINLIAIEKKLPSNIHNYIKEYDGLNHLFQPCTTGLPTEYEDSLITIDYTVLEDIVSWLKSLYPPLKPKE